MERRVKILLAFVFAAGLILLVSLSGGLKALVESLGSQMTQSQVSLASVDVSPFSGEGRFQGLVIGNPQGFETPQAFSLGEISFTLDNNSLTTDTLVLISVHIVAPQVTLEPGRNGSNLDQLQKNIASYLESSASEDSEPSRKIVIQDLLITEGQLSYGLIGGKTLDLRLPEIHLTRIGTRDQGVSVAEAIAKIITAISNGAAKAAIGSDSVKDIGDSLEQQLKDKTRDLKKLFKR